MSKRFYYSRRQHGDILPHQTFLSVLCYICLAIRKTSRHYFCQLQYVLSLLRLSFLLFRLIKRAHFLINHFKQMFAAHMTDHLSDLLTFRRNQTSVGRFNSTASGESFCKICDETCLALLQGAANQPKGFHHSEDSGESCTVED